jgi:hypothetical protein
MKTPRALGIQIMGVWLLIWGINFFLGASLIYTLLAVLAVVAGLLILANR